MPTATLPQPTAARPARQAAPAPRSDKSDRVDESAAVIRGVKVLGVQSKNTGRVLGLDQRQFGPAIDKPYRYALTGLKAACPLYEGARVFSNHTEFDFSDEGQRIVTGGERKNEELLGWLRNCRVVETEDDRVDGLYADLEYLKSHPFSARLIEVARRNDKVLALSHEAGFDAPQLVNGQIQITRITEVNSVALVASPPGTTNGLFETASNRETRTMPTSATSQPKTIRQILESLPPTLDGRQELMEAITDSGQFNQLADMPVPTPDERQADPNEQLKRAMLAAINSKLPELNVGQMKGVMKACGLSDSISETIAKREEVAAEPVVEAPVAEEQVPAVDPAAPAPVDPNAPPVEEPVSEAKAEPDPNAVPVDPNAAPAAPAIPPEEEQEQVVAEACDKPHMEGTPDPEKKKDEVQESAARQGAVLLECVGLLNARGIPVKPQILETMAREPTPEKREQFAAALVELAQRDLPDALREPRSAPVSPKHKGMESAADPGKIYETPEAFAKALQGPRGW